MGKKTKWGTQPMGRNHPETKKLARKMMMLRNEDPFPSASQLHEMDPNWRCFKHPSFASQYHRIKKIIDGGGELSSDEEGVLPDPTGGNGMRTHFEVEDSMYNSSDDSDYEHQGATDDSDDDLLNSTPSPTNSPPSPPKTGTGKNPTNTSFGGANSNQKKISSNPVSVENNNAGPWHNGGSILLPYTIFEHEEDIATSNTIKKRKFLVVKIHLLSAAMDMRGPGYKIELDRSNNSLVISTQLFNSQRLFWGEDGAKLFEAVIPNVPGMTKSMLVHNHSITMGHITLNHTLYPRQVMVIKLPRKVRSLHDNIPLSITYIAKDNPERIDDNFSCLTVCIEQDWVDHDRPSEKEFAYIRSPPHYHPSAGTAAPPAAGRFASSTNANIPPPRHNDFHHGHSSRPFNMNRHHQEQQGNFQGASEQGVGDSLGSGVSEASSQVDEQMNSQQRSSGSSAASRSARFNAQAHSFEQRYNNMEAGAQRRCMQTEQEILNRYQSFEASQFAELQRMREYLRQELQEDILNSIFSSGRRVPNFASHHQNSNAGNNGTIKTTSYPAAGVGATNPPQEPQHHIDSRVVSLGDHDDGQQQDYPADVESLSDSFSHLSSSNNL